MTDELDAKAEAAPVPTDVPSLMAAQNAKLDAIVKLLTAMTEHQAQSCRCVERIARALEVAPPAPPKQAVGPGGKR